MRYSRLSSTANTTKRMRTGMKKTAILSALTLASLYIVPSFFDSKTLHAASQNECAIWLCLPSGFPSGCGKAKSAMRKRLRRAKSPLPGWSSCATGSQPFRFRHQRKVEYHHSCNSGSKIVVNDDPRLSDPGRSGSCDRLAQSSYMLMWMDGKPVTFERPDGTQSKKFYY